MIINITHSTGEEEVFECNTFPISLGRSDECEICITSDNISRKHLEISVVEGVIYIKDLTLANWVSYNNEKLSKSEAIQYFDFAPLTLPGGISVELNLYKDNSKKIQEQITEGTTSQKVDIYSDKISKLADKKIEGKKKKKQAVKPELIIMVLIFLIAGAFFYNKRLETNQKQFQATRKRRVPKKDIKRPNQVVSTAKKNGVKKVSKVHALYLSIISDREKCRKPSFVNLCKAILPKIATFEGVSIVDNVLYVTKDYTQRVNGLFGNSERLKFLKIPEPVLYKVLAAEKLLIPVFLEQMEKNKIKKIVVIIFKNLGGSADIKQSFQIDPYIHRKFNRASYKSSFASLKQQGRTTVFEQNLARFIKKN